LSAHHGRVRSPDHEGGEEHDQRTRDGGQVLDPRAQIRSGYENHTPGQGDGQVPLVPALTQIEDGGDDDEREQAHLDDTLRAAACRRRGPPEEEEQGQQQQVEAAGGERETAHAGVR
jgi:hypothetical protein